MWYRVSHSSDLQPKKLPPPLRKSPDVFVYGVLAGSRSASQTSAVRASRASHDLHALLVLVKGPCFTVHSVRLCFGFFFGRFRPVLF